MEKLETIRTRQLEQEVYNLRQTLIQICDWPGNLSDEVLETATGPNDARARGLMVTAMRNFAREALK